MLRSNLGKLTVYSGFSWPLALLLLVTHTTAIALLPLLSINLIAKTLLTATVVASLIYYWRRDLSAKTATSAVEWSEPSGWTFIDQSGERTAATLHGSSYLHRHLVILNLRLSGGAERHLVLTEGALGADVFRRLRVLLQAS